MGPGLSSLHLRHTGPVYHTLTCAIQSLVACLVAEPALLRIGWAVAGSVTLDTAGVASARERTLDTLVGAVSLVVANLAAVEALAGETVTFMLVGAVAGKVAGLAAAACTISTSVLTVIGEVHLHAACTTSNSSSNNINPAAGITAAPRAASTGVVGITASFPALIAACVRVSTARAE
jgi:hypothetical protein